MTCMRGRHGGQAAQAKRRGEEWVACLHCGQPPHPRRLAHPYEPEERITPLRLLGLCVFVAFMFAVLLYALPVVLIGLAGGAT